MDTWYLADYNGRSYTGEVRSLCQNITSFAYCWDHCVINIEYICLAVVYHTPSGNCSLYSELTGTWITKHGSQGRTRTWKDTPTTAFCINDTRSSAPYSEAAKLCDDQNSGWHLPMIPGNSVIRQLRLFVDGDFWLDAVEDPDIQGVFMHSDHTYPYYSELTNTWSILEQDQHCIEVQQTKWAVVNCTQAKRVLCMRFKADACRDYAPDIEHGYKEIDAGVLTYYCDRNYHFPTSGKNSTSFECKLCDSVNVTGLENCTVTQCNEPYLINGVVSYTKGNAIGDETRFTCRHGFRFYNSSDKEINATCNLDARNGVAEWCWVPPCMTLRCPTPPDIANATVLAGGLFLGNVATYTCEAGFITNITTTLEAKATCTLTITGFGLLWTDIPECKALQCHNPPVITNATVYIRGLSLGDVATYTCNAGFVIDLTTSEFNATCTLTHTGLNALWDLIPACQGNETTAMIDAIQTTTASATTTIQTTAIYHAHTSEPDTTVLHETTASIEQPISSEPINQPTSMEPIKQPTSSEPIEQPTSSKPIEQPTSSKPTEQPTSSELIEQPTSSEPIEQPTSSEPIEQPTSSEPIEQPTSSKPTDKPTSSEPTDKPTSREPIEQSTSSESIEQSTSSEPIEQSTSSEQIEQPTSSKPTDKPTPREPIEQPTSSDPTTTMAQITGTLIRQCHTPSVVANGNSVHTGLGVGDVATYTTAIGFSYADGGRTRSLICMTDKQWSSVHPAPQEKHCPFLPRTRGITYSSNNTHTGALVRISCTDPGAKLENGLPSIITKCTSKKQWSNKACSCAVDRCGVFPLILNCDMLAYNNSVGGETVIRCDLSYRFSDGQKQKIYKCQNDTTWEEHDHCYLETCPNLETPGYGRLSTSLALEGTLVLASCIPGYMFPGKVLTNYFLCGSDLQWNDIIVDCQKVTCPVSGAIRHGVIIGDTLSTAYNTTLTYRCDEGYRLEYGHKELISRCDELGEWTYPELSCGTGRCGPVPNISQATGSTQLALNGTVSTYTCEPGFIFDNQEEELLVGCNGDTWNITNNKCRRIECPPITLLNAKQDSTGYLYGDVIEFTCDEGYLHDNNVTHSIHCLKTGEWSKNTTGCQPIDCGSPPDIMYSTHAVSNDHSYGQKIVYTCLKKYWFRRGVHTQNTTCTRQGEWTVTEDNCTRITCSAIPIWVGDLESNTTSRTIGTVANISCTMDTDGQEQYMLATCNKLGDWEPPIDTCGAPKPKRFVPELAEANKSTTIGFVVIGIIVLIGCCLLGSDVHMMYSHCTRQTVINHAV